MSARVRAAGLVLVAVAAGLARAAVPEPTHVTPPPQPPLETVDDSSFGAIGDVFNAASDRTRLLVLLSPT